MKYTLVVVNHQDPGSSFRKSNVDEVALYLFDRDNTKYSLLFLNSRLEYINTLDNHNCKENFDEFKNSLKCQINVLISRNKKDFCEK